MNPLAGVKGVCFDVFGTIVNWDASVAAGLVSLAPGLSESDRTRFTREWRAGYMRRTKEIAAGAAGSTDVDVLHRELLDEMLAQSDWKSTGIQDRDAAVQLWHKLDGWPDASSGLHALRSLPASKRPFLAVLSNATTRLSLDLASHADLPWDVIFSPELLGSYKPSSKMYLGAAANMALTPEQCAMFASHIYDLRAAAELGFRTVYIPRETEDVGMPSVKTKQEGGEVDVVVKDVGELVKYFE